MLDRENAKCNACVCIQSSQGLKCCVAKSKMWSPLCIGLEMYYKEKKKEWTYLALLISLGIEGFINSFLKYYINISQNYKSLNIQVCFLMIINNAYKNIYLHFQYIMEYLAWNNTYIIDILKWYWFVIDFFRYVVFSV